MHTMFQDTSTDPKSWQVATVDPSDGGYMVIFENLTKQRACELVSWLNGGAPKSLTEGE
jgi:hypothetical protein